MHPRTLLAPLLLALALILSPRLPGSSASAEVGGAPGGPAASSRAYIFGVSPFLPEPERKAAWRQLGALVLEGARPGDRVVVCDAWRQQPIARMTIPAGTSAPARLQVLRNELAALKRFLDTAAPAAHPAALDAALQEPQFLAFAAAQLRATPGEALTVVLVGSPLYADEAEPAFNFADGAYPADGHLAADTRASVFGTAGRRETLSGLTVHHAHGGSGSGGPTPFLNDGHRLAVTRFWALYVGAQGGVLASFAPDLALVLDRARADVRAPLLPGAAPDPADAKVQMHRALPRISAIAPTREQTERARDRESWLTAELPAGAANPPPPAGNNPVVRELRVGIRWAGALDLDLYVRPRPGATELFYGRPRTAEGVHVKDFLTAPPGANGFETIVFNAPVDLRAATGAINFYAGRAVANGGAGSGVPVEVRVWADGQVYRWNTTITASVGNHAADGERRDQHPCWRVLDLARIVGLR